MVSLGGAAFLGDAVFCRKRASENLEEGKRAMLAF